MIISKWSTISGCCHNSTGNHHCIQYETQSRIQLVRGYHLRFRWSQHRLYFYHPWLCWSCSFGKKIKSQGKISYTTSWKYDSQLRYSQWIDKIMEVITISQKTASGLAKIESLDVTLQQIKIISKFIIQSIFSNSTPQADIGIF